MTSSTVAEPGGPAQDPRSTRRRALASIALVIALAGADRPAPVAVPMTAPVPHAASVAFSVRIDRVVRLSVEIAPSLGQ